MKPLPILFALAATLHAAPPEPKFRAVTLDDKIQIGYGLAIADVDGDKQPDILLADKKQFVWYRNPGASKAGEATAWTKFVLAEDLTKNDNVCIAAQDIDGDGKCEVAVGAEWNPGDTVNSGAVFYLIPPADRMQKWEPVKFPSVEPTTHRMKWLKLKDGTWGLVVVPLHGRGNKNGEGAPVKVRLYHPPTPINDPKGEWKSEGIAESMHMTHNFEFRKTYSDLPRTDQTTGKPFIGGGFRVGEPTGEIFIAGREGVRGFRTALGTWKQDMRIEKDLMPDGAGEVREANLAHGVPLLTTIEPMHGNRLVVYHDVWHGDYGAFHPQELTNRLVEGHALACGDLLGVKSDQIVVGWRGTPGKEGSTIGLHVWTPLDDKGGQWRDNPVDDTGMSCEDMQLADLDGDGKLDIIAAGRATKNVKIYFNETPR